MIEGYIATILTNENPRRTWIAVVPRIGERIYDEAREKHYEVKAIEYACYSVGMGEDEQNLKPRTWSDFTIYTTEIDIGGNPIVSPEPNVTNKLP